MNKQQLEQLKEATQKNYHGRYRFEYYSKVKGNNSFPDFGEIIHCNYHFPFLYEMDKLKRLNRYIKGTK